MTQDEIICMARELATRHGIRMCDEDGETHGEELYCVDVDDIAEIIKQVAAHEREKCVDVAVKAVADHIEVAIALEREACAKVCEPVEGSAYEVGVYKTMQTLAAVIRARSDK